MNYKTDNKIIKLQRAGKVPEVEPVQTQRDNTSVKIFPIDTGQRRIKFKNDKQSEEILHEILAEAASKSDGRASGKFNKDLPLQTEHPELAVLFAPEFTTYGALGGAARIAGGLAASNVASNALGKAGDWVDSKLASNFVGPTMRIAGGLGGYVLGSSAINPLLRSAAGNGITMGIPKETFSDLRGQYFNKVYNKAPKPADNKYIDSTIDHLFMENPELRKIGSKQMYRQYYDTVFPASKVQIPYAHGTNSDLSEGLSKSTKQINTGAPETLGRNDMYFNLQPETSLQYVDGIGIPFGHWNKRVYWPLKEILGKPYTSDAWKTQPITSATLREKIPNRAGKFTRDTGGTNGKWLSEYKAEFGAGDKSNADFLKQLGVREGETFDDFVNRNRKIFSDIYNSGKYNGLYHVKVDASKPLKINGGNTYYSERGIWDLMKKKGADVLLHNNADNEFGSDVLVVPDVNPERIQILGSKPDMEKFRDFVGGHFQYNEPDIKFSVSENPYKDDLFKGHYVSLNDLATWKKLMKDSYMDVLLGKEPALPVSEDYLGTTFPVSDDSKQLLLNATLPRLRRNGRNISDSEFNDLIDITYNTFPNKTFDAAGLNNKIIGFYNKNSATDKDYIAIKGSENPEDIVPHELRHLVDQHLPLTDKEKGFLVDAYGSDFLNLRNEYDVFKDMDNLGGEMVTLNADAREKLLGSYKSKKLSVDLQDKIIDKVPDEKVVESIENASGYGKRFIESLRNKNLLTPERIKSFREAMKYVGAAAPVGLSTATISKEKRGGILKGQEGLSVRKQNMIKEGEDWLTHWLINRKGLLDKNIQNLNTHLTTETDPTGYVYSTYYPSLNEELSRQLSQLYRTSYKDTGYSSFRSGSTGNVRHVESEDQLNWWSGLSYVAPNGRTDIQRPPRYRDNPEIKIYKGNWHPGTILHEQSHALGGAPQEVQIRDFMKNGDYLSKDAFPTDRADYWDHPTEIYSRRNEILKQFGKSPQYKYSKDDLDVMRRTVKDKDSLKVMFLDRYTDDFLLHLFNDVASNFSKTVTPDMARNGGRFKNPLHK